MSQRDFLADALVATRESKRIEFKESFECDDPGAWCELIKDIAALANSGGGVLILGLTNTGQPSGWDPKSVLAIDPAEITNRIAKYTSDQFDGFEVVETSKSGSTLAAIRVHRKEMTPLVFVKPGTYSVGDSEQKTAFGRGTVYFRHGAKSEPVVPGDLSTFIRAELLRQRRELLANVRKVSQAPRDSKVLVIPPGSGPSAKVDRFRVVDDPDAPALARTDYDVTHPYRQKELVATINDRIGQRVVGSYEIRALRNIYKVDDRPEFFHRPKFSGSPQFSDAFVSWTMTEYQTDNAFFAKTVAVFSDQQRRLREEKRLPE